MRRHLALLSILALVGSGCDRPSGEPPAVPPAVGLDLAGPALDEVQAFAAGVDLPDVGGASWVEATPGLDGRPARGFLIGGETGRYRVLTTDLIVVEFADCRPADLETDLAAVLRVWRAADPIARSSTRFRGWTDPRSDPGWIVVALWTGRYETAERLIEAVSSSRFACIGRTTPAGVVRGLRHDLLDRRTAALIARFRSGRLDRAALAREVERGAALEPAPGRRERVDHRELAADLARSVDDLPPSLLESTDALEAVRSYLVRGKEGWRDLVERIDDRRMTRVAGRTAGLEHPSLQRVGEVAMSGLRWLSGWTDSEVWSELEEDPLPPRQHIREWWQAVEDRPELEIIDAAIEARGIPLFDSPEHDLIERAFLAREQDLEPRQTAWLARRGVASARERLRDDPEAPLDLVLLGLEDGARLDRLAPRPTPGKRSRNADIAEWLGRVGPGAATAALRHLWPFLVDDDDRTALAAARSAAVLLGLEPLPEPRLMTAADRPAVERVVARVARELGRPAPPVDRRTASAPADRRSIASIAIEGPTDLDLSDHLGQPVTAARLAALLDDIGRRAPSYDLSLDRPAGEGGLAVAVRIGRPDDLVVETTAWRLDRVGSVHRMGPGDDDHRGLIDAATLLVDARIRFAPPGEAVRFSISVER